MSASPLQQWFGVWRSLAIYYGNPTRLSRMTNFYGQFIGPGSLCFDIGAHVGSRIRPWLQLGGQVVALEPQPLLMKVLESLYGRSPNVTLLQEAAGAAPGIATLLTSATNPTVATLSANWIESVHKDPAFAHISWEPGSTVAVTTLDDLISRFGRPDYCKIDVEGFELEVLLGLSQAVPVVSFEYIPVTIDRAAACADRLSHLGDYEYNWFEGESHRWQSDAWLGAGELEQLWTPLARQRRSGDIFARCRSIA